MKKVTKGLAWILALGLMFCASGCGRRAEDQVQTQVDISDGVYSLEMEIGAADIRIEESDQFSVSTDNPYITIDVVGGTLVIREKPHIANLKGSTVTIRYPKDTFFSRADIDVGAGVLRAFSLNCGELDLDLGAGLTRIELLVVTGETEITGGAGEIQIPAGSLNDLDLDLGVGECVLRAGLTGRTDIEAGVGKLDMTVLGNANDYTIRTEQGLGGITIDGIQVGRTTIGTGVNQIDIVGGVGSIDLRFDTEHE